MLLDHRTYTVVKGTLDAQLKIYEDNGYAVQTRYLGEPLAFLHDRNTPDGDTYVHIWIYENEQDRLDKRAALQADPIWQRYVELNKQAGYMTHQHSRLMQHAPFTAQGETGIRP